MFGGCLSNLFTYQELKNNLEKKNCFTEKSSEFISIQNYQIRCQQQLNCEIWGFLKTGVMTEKEKKIQTRPGLGQNSNVVTLKKISILLSSILLP